MFSYRKKTAIISLVIYFLITAIIFAFSLLPNKVSSSLSNSFYDLIAKMRFGDGKMSENKEDVYITSIEIGTSYDKYPQNTRVSVLVKSVTPENYTEGYSLRTDDADVINVKSEFEFVTFAEGSAHIWLESDCGVKSNVLTITVYKKDEGGSTVDPALLSVLVPDSVRINEAFYPYYTYDGKRVKVGNFLSDKPNVSKNPSYFVFDTAGTVTLSFIAGEENIWQKTIEVVDKVAPTPEISFVEFADGIKSESAGDTVTLVYGTVYTPIVNFTSGEKTAFGIEFRSDNKPKTSGSYNKDRTGLTISFLEYGKFTLFFKSPLSAEPIYSVDVDIIPPRANVLGLKQTDIVYEGKEFPIKLRVTDDRSLEGITCTITHADGLSYSYIGETKVVFEKEGAYTITYRSDYYDDFEYVYTVIVESNKNAVSLRKALGHAALFALLGVFAVLSFGFFSKKIPFKALNVFLSGSVVAAIGEILQLPAFSDGRSARFIDVLIDLAGFSIGVISILAILFIIYRSRLKKSRSDSLVIDE